jgi:hypothetical protein
VKFITVQGLLEPEPLEQRDRKPIPGIEAFHAVTRTGRVWSVERTAFLKSTHDVLLLVGADQIYAKTPLLVAMTWLDVATREAMRAECASMPASRWLAHCVTAAAAHGVGYPAMQWVGLLAESAFAPITLSHDRFGQVLPEPAPGAWNAQAGWGDAELR